MVFNKSNWQSWIQYEQVLSAIRPLNMQVIEDMQSLGKAVSILDYNQQAMALSTKGLTHAQIDQVMASNGVAEADRRQALAALTNKSAREQLTVEMAQDILVSRGLTRAKADEVLVAAKVDIADKQAIINKSNLNKQLLINKLTQEGYTAAEIKGIAAALGLSTTTNTLTASIRGLGAAIKANPLGIILMALSLVTMAVQKFNQSQEESLQKAKELANAYKQEKDSLENLRQEYLDIVDSDETEAKKNKQLIEWKKKLVKAYKEEKDAIDGVTTARETGFAVIDKEQYYNALDLLEKNEELYAKAKKTMEHNEFAYTASDSGAGKKAADKYKEELKQFGIDISAEKRWWQTSVELSLNTKSAEEAKRKLLDALNYFKELTGREAEDIVGILENSYDAVDKKIEEYSDIYNEGYSAEATKKLYEFTQTAEGALSQVVDSESFQKWKDKVLEMAGDSEPLKNALEELADERFPEYSKVLGDSMNLQNKNAISVKKLTDAYEDLSEVLDDLFSKQDKLAGLYEKIAKSTELSASEAHELIELFPELTSHLVRVGSKWSFDIKGVNEAFDKLEDEFAEKAQETIDNNKKVIEQSFEDYYAENTKVSLDKILEDFEADPNDTSSPEYEAALFEYDEQLKKEKEDILKSYTDRLSEANSEIEKAIAFQQLLNAQINDFDFDVDNYNDKIKELMDASEKMADGEALSYEELTSLIDKFPDLTYSGKDGEYFIEKSALDELIEKSYEERNARIDDEIAKTYAVNEEAANRIKAYEDEATRIENAIEENRKKYDESYNNPDLTEGVLERIELEAERGKLIEELNALDKEQYEADKALMESQSEYSEAYRKYLEALKGKLTGNSKDKEISDELQNEIDYYKNIISAVEIMRDKYSEAIDEEIDALEAGKDALQEANDERQRELDLIEARNNLENAKKRKVWVYSDDGGFRQVRDEGAFKEAEEKYRDAITEIQVAEIDKEIELREKQKEALEENTKALTELEQNIQDALTVEQAKADFGLSDEKELLNLPADVQESIKNGLADAMTQKNNKENEGTKHKEVTLDDILKSFGAKVSASELPDNYFKTITKTAFDSVAKTIADELKAYTDNSVTEIINNNGNVINNTFNITEAKDGKNTAQEVKEALTTIFTKLGNSIKN